MEEIDIITAVAENGYQISPEAAQLIKSSKVPKSLLKYVLSTISESVFVIEIGHIDLAGFAASKVAGAAGFTKVKTVEKVEGAAEFVGEAPEVGEIEDLEGIPETTPEASGPAGASLESVISEEGRSFSGSDFDRNSISDPLLSDSRVTSNDYSKATSNDYSKATSNDYSKATSNDYSKATSNDYSKATFNDGSNATPDDISNSPVNPSSNAPSNFASSAVSDEASGLNSGSVSNSLSEGSVSRNVSEISAVSVLKSPGSSVKRVSAVSRNENSIAFSAPVSRGRPFSAASSGKAPASSYSASVIRSTGGPNPVAVLSDITGHSTCVGEYMQFVQYFRDRYSRLSEIIRGRINARPIESLKGRAFRRGGDSGAEEISIIGMVSDISSTSNGHKIISLEDPTGSFPVLVRNSDKELFELASRVLLDEVIGVTGSVTNDGSLMMASKLIQPDVPNSALRRTGARGKVILISDVHVGSAQFMEDAWLNFLDFLKGDSDSEALKKLSEEVRYLVVAGDLVDGIGIYPDQEKELSILDVYDQYKKAAEYFWEIPKHIQIIISPGNHDAVRQAEPQPALPERIREYFPPNITFVGNPSLLDLDGVSILVYHGRSIDDLVASVPGVSYQEPASAVLEMIKRRHLAPMYGSRVSIAPEKKDYFIIDPVPDIIHTGHVHTLGVQRYKNVLLVNSGTWQAQTEFQKRVNLMPMPAQVPVVDLADFGVTILKFDE